MYWIFLIVIFLICIYGICFFKHPDKEISLDDLNTLDNKSSSKSEGTLYECYPHAHLGIFNSEHNRVKNLNGKLLVVFNYPNYQNATIDTFIALLNNTGQLSDDTDLLFYNSTLQKNWIFNNSYNEKVPYSKNDSVFGPIDADDGTHFRYAIDQNDNSEYCYIDLDKVAPDIVEIQFSHIVYEKQWIKKQESHEGFQLLVFAEDIKDFRYLTLKCMESHLNKIIVSDGIDSELSHEVNFFSGSLVREQDGTWSYRPIWRKLGNIEDYIETISKNLPLYETE